MKCEMLELSLRSRCCSSLRSGISAGAAQRPGRGAPGHGLRSRCCSSLRSGAPRVRVFPERCLLPRAVGKVTSRPVSRVLSGECRARSATAIRLGWPLLAPSSNQPGRRVWKRTWSRVAPLLAAPIRSCSRWGLPCRGRCRRARCALTAPFHPCCHARRRFGGLLSVALSLGSPPAAVSRHRVSMEPGLSSTGRHDCLPAAAVRPTGSGHKATWPANVKSRASGRRSHTNR